MASDESELRHQAIAELGEPIAIFRVAPRRQTLRWVFGTLLAVFAVVANYWFWVEAGRLKFNKLIFLLLFGTPTLGVALLYAAWRDRGLAVLLYPQGVFRLHRGAVAAFPWDEITHFTLKASSPGELNKTFDPDQTPTDAYFPLDDAEGVTGSTKLTLFRADGEEEWFNASLQNFAQFARVVQREVFGREWPKALAKFVAGEAVEFAGWSVGRDGLTTPDNKEPLLWADAKEIDVEGGNVRVKKQGKWTRWAEKDLGEIPNPNVFLMLVEEARARAAKAAKAEEGEPGTI